MENTDKYIKSKNLDYKILNKERGEISYFSLDQVADLLNEKISNIKYYTNIFQDLLKIEIVDKELRFSKRDVNKLESLIKFKNKGMSTKEIEEYFKKLPSTEDEIKLEESNLLSVEELIQSIKEEQAIQLNDFRDNLLKELKENNTLYIQNITSTLIEAQNQNIIKLKDELCNFAKEYIDSKFEEVRTYNLELHNEFTENTNKILIDQINSTSTSLKINIENEINDFIKTSGNNDKVLIKEVRDFKNVMINAYQTESDVAVEKSKISFWKKIFA